jgi:creatinine deaminase
MRVREMLEVATGGGSVGPGRGWHPDRGGALQRRWQASGGGRNRRVQEQDPLLHGETDAFRRSGRRRSYRDTVMVTTLAPCWYCSGLVRQFGIPKVVVGESFNFSGGIDWLRQMRRRGRGSGLEAMHRASGRLHRRASRTLARGHRPALRRAGACRRLTTWADGPQAQFAQSGSAAEFNDWSILHAIGRTIDQSRSVGGFCPRVNATLRPGYPSAPSVERNGAPPQRPSTRHPTP